MATTQTIVLCASGTKWSSISGTPDPCPSGQHMTAMTVTYADPQDLQAVRAEIQQLDDAYSVTGSLTDLDPAALAGVFGFALTTVILMHVIGVIVGSATRIVRQA